MYTQGQLAAFDWIDRMLLEIAVYQYFAQFAGDSYLDDEEESEG